MSVSKRWVSDRYNVEIVLNGYRDIQKLQTMQALAQQLGTTFHNVQHILRMHMPEAERKALKALRYSVSKTGTKNPMKGKVGPAHHNWKELCSDGYGYMTCLHKGKRVFVHRLVMAQALKLEPWDLPQILDIHHIDEDKSNNDLDNLALVTRQGHMNIHFLQ